MGTFITEGECTTLARLRRVGGKLKGRRDGIVTGIYLNALTCTDVVEVVEIEEGVVPLEKGFALD